MPTTLFVRVQPEPPSSLPKTRSKLAQLSATTRPLQWAEGGSPLFAAGGTAMPLLEGGGRVNRCPQPLDDERKEILFSIEAARKVGLTISEEEREVVLLVFGRDWYAGYIRMNKKNKKDMRIGPRMIDMYGNVVRLWEVLDRQGITEHVIIDVCGHRLDISRKN